MSALPIERPLEILHACSIDETQQGDAAPQSTWHHLPFELWSAAKFAFDAGRIRAFHTSAFSEKRDAPLARLRCLWMYACQYPGTRRKTPMNIPEMVQRWLPIVRGLSAGHDKAEIDRCEFELEQHIMPMLSAPVAQLRKFYGELVAALKADPTIPFFVWTTFESWGEVILKNAADGEVITLKKALALRIADMVEKDVHADLKEALMGALQWRSEAQLKAVEAALQTGESKPRLRGKESCLFLVVNEGTEQQVEVML